jgi:2-aminoethylphosphonate dioxygenase
MLTKQQVEFWDTNGYLAVPGFYQHKVAEMRKWASELAALPDEKGKWMLYYEKSQFDDKKILCRVENFMDYHPSFRDLLEDERLLSVLEAILEDKPVLFKEKINFKLPGGGGFTPHQDAPAFAIFNQPYHVTVMMCIDDCNAENGGIEFAPGYHKKGLLQQDPTGSLSSAVVELLPWELIELKAGDVLIFDSYIPHRSGPNNSSKPRTAVFATYNKLSHRSLRTEYYAAKRLYFPPEYERDPSRDYSLNNPFNLGNPIK